MIADNAAAGKLRSITYDSESVEPDVGFDLTIFYRVECENASGLASITFQFTEMRGHILAFDLDARPR